MDITELNEEDLEGFIAECLEAGLTEEEIEEAIDDLLAEEEQLDELYGRGKLDAAINSHLTKKGYKHSREKDPEGGTRHSFTKPIGSGNKQEGGFSYTRYKDDPSDKHKWANWSHFSKNKKTGKRSSWESGNDPESELPSQVKSLKEAVDNLLEGNAAEMKDNIESVISEKVLMMLEEKKKQIAATVFPRED